MNININLVIALSLLSLVISGCQGMPVKTGDILFRDDFTDPTSGWLVGVDSIGAADYMDGGLRIYVSKPASSRVSIPRLRFDDVRIDVDAVKVSGPDDNHYGVVCRYQDKDNFYFLEISSDGYYGIGKYQDGKMSLIGFTQMQSNNAIRQGYATNHLRAECIGDSFTLYLNGIRIGAAKDPAFKMGNVGLIAGTLNIRGTDILFDNFSVTKP